MQNSEIQLFNREKMMTILAEVFEIEERCEGVHRVDLGESFPTSIYLRKNRRRYSRERAPRSLGENYSIAKK